MELLEILHLIVRPATIRRSVLIVPGGTISALFVLVQLLGSVCCVGGPEGAVWQDELGPKGPARGRQHNRHCADRSPWNDQNTASDRCRGNDQTENPQEFHWTLLYRKFSSAFPQGLERRFPPGLPGEIASRREGLNRLFQTSRCER